jgi:hypothetical protein
MRQEGTQDREEVVLYQGPFPWSLRTVGGSLSMQCCRIGDLGEHSGLEASCSYNRLLSKRREETKAFHLADEM